MSGDDDKPRLEILGSDELHTRKRIWHSTNEGLERILKKMEPGSFWRKIERQLEECETILGELGFAPGVFPTDGIAEPYTEAWYAGQVGWRCAVLISARDKDRPLNEMLLAHIMAIGAWSTEWEWRLNYRPSILTGAKQRRYLSELRDAKNTAARASASERREAIAAMLPETSLTKGALTKWIRKQLLERHGIDASERTIRGDRRALGT